MHYTMLQYYMYMVEIVYNILFPLALSDHRIHVLGTLGAIVSYICIDPAGSGYYIVHSRRAWPIDPARHIPIEYLVAPLEGILCWFIARVLMELYACTSSASTPVTSPVHDTCIDRNLQ